MLFRWYHDRPFTLAKKAVGLIVTDHIMPATTGADIVRKLRDFDKEIPVMVIRGAADAEEQYKDLGVTFRTKPLAPTELISLVTNALKEAA